ncbi:hypothetical protein ACHAQA_001426 [Verticillium albo-atrum]
MDAPDNAPARRPMVDYDSDSTSGSDSDNATPTTTASAAPVEWLATGRSKRSTAGNRMKSMLANEEPDSDLELLFAEDDDDAGFTDVDDAGSDVQMDSDSDSEDERTAAADDLAGEQELEKQAKERRAAQRKRKANDAIPAKFRKKVRISEKPAEAATAAEPSAPAPRPKKKSERTSWLPTTTDMPTRASARQTTVLSKEQLHNQMVEREAKRLKQVAAMEKKAAKLEALKKPPMTQAERLAEAALVEKKNAKSLNRWEEAEKAREEERAAKLAALNNRTLKGPVITFWSGMGEWEGDANGGKTVTMEEKQPRKKREKKEKPEKVKGKADKKGAISEAAPDTPVSATSTAALAPPSAAEGKASLESTATTPATTSPNTPISTMDSGPAKLPDSAAPALKMEDVSGPVASPAASAPTKLEAPALEASAPEAPVLEALALAPSTIRPPPLQTQLQHSEDKSSLAPSSVSEAADPQPTGDAPPAPPAPAAAPQKTTRHAIILQNFADPAIANKPAQSRVLFGPRRSFAKLAKPAPAPLCAITNHPARYRDPYTGLPYFNAYAYREIQRLRRGEYRFSALVGAWVGSCTYAAKGVPAAFLGGPAAREEEKKKEKEKEKEREQESAKQNELEKEKGTADSGAVKEETGTVQTAEKPGGVAPVTENTSQQAAISDGAPPAPQPPAAPSAEEPHAPPAAPAASASARAPEAPPAEQAAPAPVAA